MKPHACVCVTPLHSTWLFSSLEGLAQDEGGPWAAPQGPAAWESGNVSPRGHEPQLPAGCEPSPQSSRGEGGC